MKSFGIGRSDIGRKRESNEDKFLADNDLGLSQILVDFANDAGGKDNITALLVHIEVDPEEKPVVPGLSKEFQVKLDALGSVFLFEDLSLAQLNRVLDVSQVREFQAEDVVVSEGETCSSLFLVLEQEPFLALLRARPMFGIQTLERLGRRLSIEFAKATGQRDPQDLYDGVGETELHFLF